jgi:hypothetical protein
VSVGCGGGWVWLLWPRAFWPQMAKDKVRSAMDGIFMKPPNRLVR